MTQYCFFLVVVVVVQSEGEWELDGWAGEGKWCWGLDERRGDE
jgi:hypothetical protein